MAFSVGKAATFPAPISGRGRLTGERPSREASGRPAERSDAPAEASSFARTWSSFWRSRLLIWAAGLIAVGVVGRASGAVHAFDPTGISHSFGTVGNLLTAPAVRWDSIWYLQIAHGGYRTLQETAFFPLYPLLI